MKNKLVSVIINCYNSEKYIKETIQSVISQTYKNWELIFYDNQSTDNSYTIYKSFKDKRFKYYKSKKFEQLGSARKNALIKAKGDFIAFLDSDDLWEKNKLKTQLKYFDTNETGFTISNSVFFNDKKKKPLYPFNKKFRKKVFYELIKNYFISFDTVIIKSSFLKKLSHTLDKKFNIIHDMDLLIRLSKICDMNYAPFALSKWRMRENSLSFNNFNNIIKEKKIFIKKISKNLNKDLNFYKSKKIFKDVLCRQEILYFISKKKMIKSFKLVKKLNFNIKNIILVIIIFLPFKKYIFNNFFNLRY